MTPETIKPYFVAFSKGFHVGFAEFWNMVTDNGNIRNERANIKKIHSYSQSPPGWPLTERVVSRLPSPCITMNTWYQEGIDAGRWYYAWYVMIENPGMFADYHLTRKESRAEGLSLNWLALYKYYAKENVLEKSGKLYQEYNKWMHPNNRTGEIASTSKTKVRNGIKGRERIIELLPEDKRQKAMDELNTFKANNPVI